MSLIARFKRDIAKHRGRSAVLAVLFVGFVGASVKAVFDLRPQTAAAAVRPALPDAAPMTPSINSADAEEHIEQSKKLWQTLREVKPSAASANVAFAFDAAYYAEPAPDPTKRIVLAETEPAKAAPAAPVEDKAAKLKREIQRDSINLVLKTTAVGNGTTPPMAIINQQLLTIGQEINGYKITAIRAREVEFVNQGVTVVVKMPEGQ